MTNRKELYSDMEKFVKTRNAQRLRYYRKTQGHERRLWTSEEIDMLMTSTMTDMELSDVIKRSVQAIQIKRNRLKKSEKGE
jgi:hypothetical protein